MSKLEELLKRECPDGVEYKKLINVCDIKRGERITKKDIKENGMFPIISGGQFPMGMYDKFNRDENTITIASYGSAGYVDYQTKKFWANDVCLCLYPKIKLLNKFLYYYLKFKQDFLYSKTTNAIPNHIPTDIIKELLIPLPPIEIQEEIVGILDTFTKYQDLLNRELELRKKQYEYYRDKLLTFGEDVEWKILNEVIISLNTGLNPRQFFRLNTDDAKNYYVTIRELQNNTIKFSEKTDKINDEALKLCNKRSNLEVGDVLFSGTGTIGETAIIDKFPNNWNIKEGIYSIKPNKSFLVPKFLMYLLKSSYIRDIYLAKADGGTVKSVPMKEMRNLKIPVPPLEEQERIVNILDKFDALCNDITRGLPAEIEMRKKQYEYYRDKLLTFKEKKK